MKDQPSFLMRKHFLRLDADDEQALTLLHRALGDGLPSLVDDFYRHLLSYPQMRALLPEAQALERLKRAQLVYFQRLTEGKYDEAYGQDRERVGLAHARIGLPPGWYFGAYSFYLCALVPRVVQLTQLTPQQQQAALQALTKVVFLDMGIAIDAYIGLRDQLITELRDYGAAFTHLPYGTVVVTAEMEVVFANHAFAQLLGCQMEQLPGTPLGQWLQQGSLTNVVFKALQEQQAHEVMDVLPQGQRLHIPVAVTAFAMPAMHSGAPVRVLVSVQDLREQKQLQRDLLQAQEVANIGTWHSMLDGQVDLTPQAARILGCDSGTPQPTSGLLDCVHPEDRAQVQEQWQSCLAQGRGVFLVRTTSAQSPRWVEVRCAFENDAQGVPTRGYGTVLDITERYLAEEHIRRLALFDALTGLANRQHGLDLLGSLLQQAKEQNARVALLFIDLDRFKEVNDTLGHSMGDCVLQTIAAHVRALVRPRDVLARLGGDEFMFARLLGPQEDALGLAQDLDVVLRRPVHMGGRTHSMGGSVGVALYPQHADSVSGLLHCADLAMYQIKAQSGGYLLYEEGMHQQQQRRIAVAQRLKQALDEGSLQLHYQPKVDLASGKMCGVEALMRWHDAQWGWVSPAEFIPVAEERGLIAALDTWALEEAARQWRAWRDSGWTDAPSIAVNVSAEEISVLDSFAEQALALVAKYEVPPQAIELEITETALMRNADQASKTTQELVAMGFSLAIDDFGTGYSSLARLHKLPLARLKIDMAFIANMLADSGSLAIVTAVIGMARALQLRTVAEGVETQEQLQALRGLQCDEIQGYVISKPLPAAQLEQHWRSH